MNYLEITGTLLGVIYLWLEYRASAWLWAASIAMPAVYLVVYYRAGLYADFAISVYYILASLYGLWCWLNTTARRRAAALPVLEISRTPRPLYAPLTLIFALLFVAIGLALSRLTDSTVPWADAFTTALSVVAMWMLARKYVEQWIVWIAVDAASVALYTYKGLWFTAALYAVYAIIALLGYRRWLSLIPSPDQAPRHEHDK